MSAASKVADAFGWLLMTLVVLAAAWLCTRASSSLKPDEVDCLLELRAATRKDAGYAEADVIAYGRCLLKNKE